MKLRTLIKVAIGTSVACWALSLFMAPAYADVGDEGDVEHPRLLSAADQSCRVEYKHTPPICNCLPNPGVITICHETGVELKIGTEFFSASTGQSASECFTYTLDTGDCVIWCYSFQCCKKKYGWLCTPKAARVFPGTNDC